MALNDDAVFTAAMGYVYVAPPGQAAPSKSVIDSFDPETTGNEEQTVTISGSPTGGDFTITFETETTSAIAYDATAEDVQTALEGLASVNVGDVIVTGGPLPSASVVVNFGGQYAGQDVSLMTTTDTFTGGSTPSSSVSETKAAWGYTSIGHTSREDLPEFGFEGGETEMRGTWQNKSLKQVVTEAPIEYVTLNIHQFDLTGLELYYGSKNATTNTGEFALDDASTSTIDKSVLIVLQDGTETIAFHASKTGIKREGAMEMATDDLTVLPLRATVLKMAGRKLFRWISIAA